MSATPLPLGADYSIRYKHFQVPESCPEQFKSEGKAHSHKSYLLIPKKDSRYQDKTCNRLQSTSLVNARDATYIEEVLALK